MSFAIIETGGKQYKVSASKILEVEKLDVEIGKTIKFENVLLLNYDKNTEVGSPNIKGASVEAKLLDNVKDRTVLVFHKRRRKHSRKKNGHRQRHSKIQITKILSKDGKLIAGTETAVVKTKIKNKVAAVKTKDKKETITKKILKKKINWISSRIKSKSPTIPISIDEEKKTNIFLRCNEPSIKNALNLNNASEQEIFFKLRDLKDNF